MMKDLIDEFHLHRASGDKKSAHSVVQLLKDRYSFNRENIVTALVTEEFREADCSAYLDEIANEEEGG